jgi:predicted kinase
MLILIGAPGAGKSTFAESFIATQKNWIRLCRDDFRAMNFNTTVFHHREERLISALIDASADCLLQRGYNVLLDATHCRSKYLNHYIRKFSHRAAISFKLFELDTGELIARCAKREAETGRQVPEDVIRRFVEDLEHLKQSFDFSPRPCVPRRVRE